MLVAIVLGSGILAGVNATRLSSTRSDLHTTQTDLDTVKKALADAQAQASDSKATVTNQAATISSFKTCINDLNILFAADINNTSAVAAAGAQARKDCVPLGLLP